MSVLNLWPECDDILQKYFVYDKILDLLNYDSIESLKSELSLLKKDSYPINYRFIFLHYDTDYYVYQTTPGILLTNLQIILQELDIPNYFCLIITNYNNIEKELEVLRSTFTTDSYPIGSILCQLQQLHVVKNLTELELNVKSIEKSYSCFNRNRRSHRHVLVSLLNYHNLLEKGLISYVY